MVKVLVKFSQVQVELVAKCFFIDMSEKHVELVVSIVKDIFKNAIYS